MKKDNRFWLWGYTLDTVPGPAFFVQGATRCSLETAADYLQVSNVCWMNSLHNMECLNEKQCERLQKYDTFFCGLTISKAAAQAQGTGSFFIRNVLQKSLNFPKSSPISKALSSMISAPPRAPVKT